jgi:hypothetical protein
MPINFFCVSGWKTVWKKQFQIVNFDWGEIYMEEYLN